MTLSALQTKINQAKDLDFGTIFNQSVELFKKVWLQGLLTLIITIVMMIPFYGLIYLPVVAVGIVDPQALNQSSETNLVVMIPFLILTFVLVFVVMAVSLILQAAFFRICMQKDMNTEERDDYFYFFKKRYIGKALQLSLLSAGIALLATALCIFPIIYVSIPLSFFAIVFAFNPELSAIDIVKASFSLGNKKWLLTFGLGIVAGVLAQFVGMLLCGIGILVTASFVHLPVYHIYKEVIGFDNDDYNTINKIGETELVD